MVAHSSMLFFALRAPSAADAAADWATNALRVTSPASPPALHVVDVQALLPAPISGQHPRSHSDGRLLMFAEWTGTGKRFCRLKAGMKSTVDEGAPHGAEAHAADELFDVDAAVAQRKRTAFAVGFGDLGLEAMNPLGAGNEVPPRSAMCVAPPWSRLPDLVVMPTKSVNPEGLPKPLCRRP